MQSIKSGEALSDERVARVDEEEGAGPGDRFYGDRCGALRTVAVEVTAGRFPSRITVPIAEPGWTLLHQLQQGSGQGRSLDGDVPLRPSCYNQGQPQNSERQSDAICDYSGNFLSFASALPSSPIKRNG